MLPPSDPAVLLANTLTAMLAEHHLDMPATYISSNGLETTIDLVGLRSRHQGERISGLQREMRELFGCAPQEELQDDVLRLTFPADTTPKKVLTPSDPTLWLPLGQTASGERILLNLPMIGTLLVVGEDHNAMVAFANTVAGAAVNGSFGPPPELLLAEEQPHYFSAYQGHAQLFDGPEAAAQITRRAVERQVDSTRDPLALAIVLFPSLAMQAERLPMLIQVGPAGYVFPIILTDTPTAHGTRALGYLAQGLLLYHVGEPESRSFLGQPAAEQLHPYTAIHRLAETRRTLLLHTYATSDEAIQALLDRTPPSATGKKETPPTSGPAATSPTPQALTLSTILTATLDVGEYDVALLTRALRGQGISRETIITASATFESAGLIRRAQASTARRPLLLADRKEAQLRLTRYLEEQP